MLAEYNHAMRGERACEMSAVEWARRQGWSFDPKQFFDTTDLGAMPDPIQLLRLMPGGWYRLNMLKISQFYEDYALAVVNEHTRRVAPEVSAAGTRAIEDLRDGPSTVFARLVLPSLTRAAIRTAQMQTWVDAARVACALERYHLANGKWPDSLDALTPKFMEKVPVDVIDGQKLRYHQPPEGGYLLYSVGWNKKDDGGTSTWTTEKKHTVEASEGDWVWSVPK
jgi:hypothetical protein